MLELLKAFLAEHKDEYPDKTFERCIFLAPKTYVYRFTDGTVKKVLKGVRNWNDKVYTQSLFHEFREDSRVALDPHKEQKRTLYKNAFENTCSYSPELAKKYEEAKGIKDYRKK